MKIHFRLGIVLIICLELLQSGFITFISPGLMRDIAFQLGKISWVCYDQVFVRNGVIPGEVQVGLKVFLFEYQSGRQHCHMSL